MELDLRDLISIIRKRIWLIISIVLVTTLVTGVVSFFFMNPTYEASTKLIVNTTKENQEAAQIDLNSINLNIRLIDTYKEVIKTVRIMDAVIERYPELNLTAEELIRTVKVSSVNNTQVMTLAVQDQSHERAVSIVNAVSHVFASEIPSIMSMTVDNVSILAEAKLVENPVPVKPNKKLNVAIGFVVSFMLALGLAFLLEYLDDTIKTEEDIQEYLGLPTLALITKMKEEDYEQHSTAKRKQAGDMSSVPVNH